MRRLEGRLGEPLFRSGRPGVELDAARRARSCPARASVLAAHDRAAREVPAPRPRRRPVRPRHDRRTSSTPCFPSSLAPPRTADWPPRHCTSASTAPSQLVERLAPSEVDAAIVLDPGDAPARPALGPRSPALVGNTRLAGPDPPPHPFPLVAYDPPCSLRDARLAPGPARASTPRSRPRARISPASTPPSQRLGLRAARSGRRRPAPVAPARWPRRSGAAVAPARPRAPAPRRPTRAALWRATMRRSLPEAAYQAGVSPGPAPGHGPVRRQRAARQARRPGRASRGNGPPRG